MANFPAKMEYPAEFLRGWPVDGGLELSYPIADFAEQLEAGHLVRTTVEGKIEQSDATTDKNVGIVVRGNKDDKSMAASGKAIVLFGHYIVKLTKSKFASGTLPSLGAGVGPSTSPGLWASSGGTYGTVIEVNNTDGYEGDAGYAIVVVR